MVVGDIWQSVKKRESNYYKEIGKMFKEWIEFGKIVMKKERTF